MLIEISLKILCNRQLLLLKGSVILILFGFSACSDQNPQLRKTIFIEGFESGESSSPFIELVGHYYDNDEVYACEVATNSAFVGIYRQGIHVIDISMLSSPVFLGAWTEPVAIYKLRIMGDYAYSASGSNGLNIVNFANFSAPTLTGTYSVSDCQAVDVTIIPVT